MFYISFSAFGFDIIIVIAKFDCITNQINKFNFIAS